jgi:hypothetical protein
MATINNLNEPTAASGKVLQGQGIGVASNFSTATYPATATGTGTILRADGTNNVATTATYPNTVSSGDIITATASNVVGSLALPTNVWQVGSMLNYNGTSPNWMNFAKEVYIYEEWINSASSGWLGWNTANGASATITVNDFVSPTVVGNVSLNTGTSSYANAYIGLGNTVHPMTFSGGRCIITFLAKLSRVATSASNYKAGIGFISDTSDIYASQSALVFYCRQDENSGNWQLLARNATSTTVTNTSTAPDTNWHKFTIDVNAAASSAEFFIDGSSLGTVASNIPAASGTTHTVQPGILFENGDSAISESSTLIIDAMWMYQTLTNQR